MLNFTNIKIFPKCYNVDDIEIMDIILHKYSYLWTKCENIQATALIFLCSAIK